MNQCQIKNTQFYSCDYGKSYHTFNLDTHEITIFDDLESILLHYFNISKNEYFYYKNIHLLTNSTLSNFDNYPNNTIKIGEYFIPLNVLKTRSKLIKSMLDDLNNINSIELPYNDLLKNINIYIYYIKTNYITDEIELFKIMNYLDDIDVEHIASIIAKNTYTEKHKIYDNLELLYNSPFTAQFIYLLKRILRNENYEDITYYLGDKLCYNFLLKYNLMMSNTVVKSF